MTRYEVYDSQTDQHLVAWGWDWVRFRIVTPLQHFKTTKSVLSYFLCAEMTIRSRVTLQIQIIGIQIGFQFKLKANNFKELN